MTTKTNKARKITTARLYRDVYDIKKRERELFLRRWKDMPNDQMAIMGANAASEYLGVSRNALKLWHDRGLLVGIVSPTSHHKKYLLGHLWVFKVLMLEAPENDL